MKLLAHLILAGSILIALSGCKTTEYLQVRSEVPVIHPTEPDPIESKEVEFKVWNKELLVKNAKEAGGDGVWYVLDSESVKNLNDNILEAMRYIQQSQGLSTYYKDLLDGYNESVREEQAAAEAAKVPKKKKFGF